MANDPGFANDTCIFMEAVAGDGGTHNPNDVWWLSPDITLVGPVSGPEKADPGLVNPVQLKFHRKSGNCNFPGDESLTVQLWVANPSLVMAPNDPASATLVGFIGTPVPAPGGNATQQIDWTPPTGLPPDDPQSPGHKCLVARVYPETLTPSNNSFFVPDDQHVAQHNLCIVPCGGPGALSIPGPCGLRVTTLNPGRAQIITLRAVLDLHPNDFVKKTVLQRAKRIHGFRQLATGNPKSFKFDLSKFPGAEIVDHSQSGAIPTHGPPNFVGKIPMTAAQLVKLTFTANLQGSAPGNAFIIHLTQTDSTGRAQGGLTVVLIAV